MRRLDELWYRLEAVEALRLLKKNMSYEKLSSMIDLPPSVLSRYINGHVVPSLEKSRIIFSTLKREFLSREVWDRLERDEVGAIDTSRVIYDPVILKFILMSEYEKLLGFKVDKVMTMESDGIPVAYQLASILGTEVAVVRKSKKIGVRNFIEVKQIFESGAYRYIYLPENLVKKGECILLVDDMIRTGATMRALAEFCKKIGATVSGIFTIVAMASSKDKLHEELNISIEAFMIL